VGDVPQTYGFLGFGPPTLSRSFDGMVYVVERYVPGLSRSDLHHRLSELERTLQGLRAGGRVRYLGSTIVLEDEACYCQFEGPSQAAVAEANRQAGLSFDRIVPAVTIEAKGARR
jgi:Nickel responsive protein SCO4226-like